LPIAKPLYTSEKIYCFGTIASNLEVVYLNGGSTMVRWNKTKTIKAADGKLNVVVIDDNGITMTTPFVEGNDAYLWVSKSGNDSIGNGSFTNPYLTITKAMAEVSEARKTIMIMPGVYAEASALVWSTSVSGIILKGLGGNQWDTVISALTGDQVIDVTPGAQSATFELTLSNLVVDHDISGQDGLDLDNTGMTKKLNVYLGNVGFGGDAADKSIVTLQGDTSNAIRIYWDSQNGDCEGKVYLDAGNNGNRFYADNVNLAAGLQTAADAVAFDIRLKYCGVLHEGVTGGNAAQTITAIGCWSQTGSTFAALDSADLAGTHTESIVSV
jgi:hypothetical protein